MKISEFSSSVLQTQSTALIGLTLAGQLFQSISEVFTAFQANSAPLLFRATVLS